MVKDCEICSANHGVRVNQKANKPSHQHRPKTVQVTWATCHSTLRLILSGEKRGESRERAKRERERHVRGKMQNQTTTWGKQQQYLEMAIQRLHNPILIDMLRSFDEPLAMAVNDTRIYQPRPLVNCPMHNLRSRFHICCVASRQPNKDTHTLAWLEFLGET